MKCASCVEDIPSKFTYAIATNVCPFCGEKIMEEQLQKVLNGLREVMNEVVDGKYEVEAFDWLKSNYNLISKDGEDYSNLILEIGGLKTEIQDLKEKGVKPTPKSVKKVTELKIGVDDEGNEVQLNGDQIQDNNTASSFMDRAMVKRNPNKNLKDIANQLKGGGGSGGGMNIDYNMMSTASADELEQWENMLAGSNPLGSSKADDFEDGGYDPIMNQFIQGGGPSTIGAKASDLQTLAKMKAKMAQNQRGNAELKFK